MKSPPDLLAQRRIQRSEAASNFYTLTIVNIKRDSFELCILLAEIWIDVAKSASHQQSQTEIASDNARFEYLSCYPVVVTGACESMNRIVKSLSALTFVFTLDRGVEIADAQEPLQAGKGALVKPFSALQNEMVRCIF